MRCTVCKRSIAAGVEARKMIVEYVQADGTVRTLGYLMPDGPLTAATGQLRRGWHSKCFHAARKRVGREAAALTEAAADAAALIATARAQDPGYDSPPETDWRDQVAAELPDFS